MPKPEAPTAHREQQRARQRAASVPVDPDDALLMASVLHRSLTIMETDARHLHRKNAKALQLAIEKSKGQVVVDAATKGNAARHANDAIFGSSPTNPATPLLTKTMMTSPNR